MLFVMHLEQLHVPACSRECIAVQSISCEDHGDDDLIRLWQVREFTYRTHRGSVSAAIREGTLSEGVGVRLWIAAHALCRSAHTCHTQSAGRARRCSLTQQPA